MADNPFRKPKNPFRQEGSVALGPVEPLGVAQADVDRVNTNPIYQGLRRAQQQSNAPAMAQAREGMRPTAAGTAVDIAFSQVLSPVLPRTAEEAADRALERFIAGGGDASANANLFGAASAVGAVGGNLGLGYALPNVGGVVRGMSLKQIASQLLKAGVVEGGTGAVLGGAGALVEGATPREALDAAAMTGLQQAGAGIVLRGAPLAVEGIVRGVRDLGEGGATVNLREAFGSRGGVSSDAPPVSMPPRGLSDAPVARETERRSAASPLSSLRRRAAEAIDPSVVQERRQARVDTRTGLGSRLAFDEARPALDADPNTHWASLDVRGLKRINDTVSPDAADALIAEVGRIAQRTADEVGLPHGEGGRVYTPKGDELLAAGSEAQVREFHRLMEERTPKEWEGVPTGIRGGVARTVGEADQLVNAAKAAEKANAPEMRTPVDDLLAQEPVLAGRSVTDESGLEGASTSFLDFLHDESGAVGGKGERVVAAAWRSKDGEVFTGATHADAIDAAARAGVDESVTTHEDGFVTSSGRFVTRPEALAMARERGQLRNPAYRGAQDGGVTAEALNLNSEAGTGAPRILAGTAGGIGGAAYGATQGDTPEERAKNALLYGLGGLAAGVGAGYAAERIGANRAVREIETATDLPLARAGKVGTRFVDRAPPKEATSRADFGAVLPPARLRIVGDAPPIPSHTPYINPNKFGVEGEARARLIAEAERVGREVQGDPRRRATWEEWRQAAASIGITDLTRKDVQSWGQVELLAARNILSANTNRLTALDAILADATTEPSAWNTAMLEQKALAVQTDLLMRRFIPARTEAARAFNSLRMQAAQNFEPAFWLTKAQTIKGEPLTDGEFAALRGFLALGDREGMVNFVAKLHQSSGQEKALSFWTANLLTNPKTHAVNITSNLGNQVLDVADDAAGGLWDQALSLATGQRALSTPSRLQGEATWTGAREGIREAWQVVRGKRSAEDLAKMDIPRDVNFDNPVVDGYAKFVRNLLSAEDRVFRVPAFRRSLANQAEVLAAAEGLRGEARTNRARELMGEPTTEMSLRAIAESEEAVFQDRTAIGDALSGFVRPLKVGSVPVGEYFVARFRRTPGAVATRILERTFGLPFGLGKIVAKATQGELRGISRADQRVLAKLLGRGSTGLGVIAAGYFAAQRGWLTAPRSRERPQAQTDEMRGVLPSAVVLSVGGRSLQLDVGRLSPVGNLMAVGALMAESANDRDPATSKWAAGALGGARTVTDQPFLVGVANAREALDEPGGGVAQRIVGGVARGFIPMSGLLGGVARGIDPVARRTAPDVEGLAGFAQGVGRSVASGVPGLSRTLPARLDPLGQPIRREGGALGVASEVALPVRALTAKHDPVLDAIDKYDITLSALTRKHDETAAQYEERAQRVGGYRREELENTLASKEWNDATTYEESQALLETALRRAGNRAARDTRSSGVSAADRLRQLKTANPFRGLTPTRPR